MKISTFTLCQLPFLLAGLALAQTQQPIGTVGVQDATVAGALEITNGRAVLVGSTAVTAHDRMAEVALNRGGSVRVCATSGLHIAEGKSATSASTDQPLMLALDRGAIEVRMAATTRDVVMTPDLRFSFAEDGPLDLNLRVTKNGDTCVENRGAKAPLLHVADQFGEGSYELRPGQHVLFEHASLKEVVDHESSSCGCPPEPAAPAPPAMTVADALLNPAAAKGTNESTTPATPAKIADEQHPFPAAVSEGLAPPAAVPQSPAGALHSQVSAMLSSNNAPDSTAEPAASSAPVATTSAPATSTSSSSNNASVTTQNTQPASSPHKGVFHAVGRFFRRIFGGG